MPPRGRRATCPPRGREGQATAYTHLAKAAAPVAFATPAYLTTQTRHRDSAQPQPLPDSRIRLIPNQELAESAVAHTPTLTRQRHRSRPHVRGFSLDVREPRTACNGTRDCSLLLPTTVHDSLRSPTSFCGFLRLSTTHYSYSPDARNHSDQKMSPHGHCPAHPPSSHGHCPAPLPSFVRGNTGPAFTSAASFSSKRSGFVRVLDGLDPGFPLCHYDGFQRPC